MIMVDPGAINSFISLHTTNRLKILYTNHNKFAVTLGNGEKYQRKGQCRQLHI